jgi:hypothetical protein
MNDHIYTIKASDVGRATLKIHGSVVSVSSFMGQVLPMDVGKRIYYRRGVLQVENNEQRDRRLAEDAPKWGCY